MAYCITLSLYSVRLWRESQILWTWAVTRVIDELLFNLYRLLKSYYVKVRLFSYTTGLKNFPRHYFFSRFLFENFAVKFCWAENLNSICLWRQMSPILYNTGGQRSNQRQDHLERVWTCVCVSFGCCWTEKKRRTCGREPDRGPAIPPPIPKENKMKRIQTAVCRALWSSPRRKWKPVGGNITRWNIRRSCCYAGLDPFK